MRPARCHDRTRNDGIGAGDSLFIGKGWRRPISLSISPPYYSLPLNEIQSHLHTTTHTQAQQAGIGLCVNPEPHWRRRTTNLSLAQFAIPIVLRRRLCVGSAPPGDARKGTRPTVRKAKRVPFLNGFEFGSGSCMSMARDSGSGNRARVMPREGGSNKTESAAFQSRPCICSFP